MTKVYNRAELERSVTQLVRESQLHGSIHALCYVDLDTFKVINTAHGHRASDALRTQIVQRLSCVARKSDMLARIDEDKYALLLTHCDWNQAQHMAQSVRAAMSHHVFEWDTLHLWMDVSIGVAPISELSNAAGTVMQVADTACAVARKFGANSIHISVGNDIQVARYQMQIQWANGLRAALAESRVEIFAQPIIDLSNPGAAPCHEALARVRSADGTLWEPEAFMDSAARYGLLRELDQTVVRTVLAYLRSHADMLKPYQWLSINLCGSSLVNSEFTRFLETAIRESGVAPEKLCFEITETTMITNLAQAGQCIDTLRAQGCKFALDDFGTGASSFHYLKALPVDYIKIDGAFIRDLLAEPFDWAVVDSINQIAHIKGMQTVAECVETPAVEAALKSLGVDLAQGHYYAVPKPIAQVMGRAE